MNANDITRLSELGVATVYEASGREGLIDIPLIQIIPNSRVAGPARTALCGQDDNLMVHAVIEQIQPGEVLVLSMPEPTPVALIGELLATQVKVRGAAGILVDASVRDVNELVELGLPIWSHFIRVRGATKTKIGELNTKVTVGGTAIAVGDIVVLDADGGVCVKRERVDEVLKASEQRLVKENALRKKLLVGQISYDLHGLREYVERNQK
ncbi:MAG TPA: 4-carboxy-4-hydroxy-2-oxoadipate aldolase/oxaloacetate decarboxylase [Anaerolineales bacterium]|nr:4-carboxy-4-hydroxy-2-oxoadipate aldolase/oxaloacetate decarboxylase [Anaerolineales bacterium]